ncbi:extracellular solute-binding protein [Ferrimonas marina]|uniref:Putrescine-binding periplasmic protein n=1 Tax=Ferrimonas marina TaxID=299255 RepID=A0A1M5NCH7_9GAMM|nr:extracellular solute-binding protein [Ferrimonas marina]SHG86889.1 spermidine/putrescine transport system substrate-binding protein [Ferrimonas marina]
MKTLTKRLIATLLVALPGLVSAQDDVVYFYNWSEYIPDGLLQEFEKETGIKVIYTTYDSNEAMYAKLKLTGSEGYDIVVPSTYYIAKMAEEKMLQPLDKSKLSNLGHLDPALMDKEYDPGNTYSLPYIWGATGIGINTDEVDPDSITSWADLWDSQWRGELMLMNDTREVFHMALRINGHSSNSTDPKEIEQAYELLKKLMPNALTFNSDNPGAPFISGDTVLGMIWNGSAFEAQKEDPAISMIYPKEGAIFWMDNLAIPAGAKNTEAAHKLIDFLLRPEIAAKVCEEIGYPTPNKTAKGLLDEDFANNPMVFPPAEIIEAGEFQSDVGEAIELYDRYWQRLRTGR